MNKECPKTLYSGASPEEIAADLKPLIKFQEKGIPLNELKVLIEKNHSSFNVIVSGVTEAFGNRNDNVSFLGFRSIVKL